MVAKSVIDIDVQDEKFQSFLEKFNEYQKALEELPEQWRGAAHGLGETAKETERVRGSTEAIVQAFTDGVAAIASVNDGLDRLNGNLEKANKSQKELNKKTSGVRNFLNKASKDAKSLAGHIKDATTSLLSWGTVLGLFTGLSGAGGLWGMNRLAGSASAQRFTAMGLGTTAGGLNSAAINYQKVLGNPVGTLGAIRDSQLDLSKRWQFNAMGVNPNQDPAALLPQMIKSARDIFVRNGSTLQGAEAYGLTNYFSLDDLNRFKKMSDAEIDAMTKQAQKDAQRLQLTDQQLKQWQDFNVQVDRSKTSIENAFIKGLGPLTPSLEKLSDSVSQAIQSFLESPMLAGWVDDAAVAIKKFGSYLSSSEFKQDVEDFMNGVSRLAKLLTGELSISDFLRGSSSILSNEPVTDSETGEKYVKGGLEDPKVWSGMKGAARAWYKATGSAPSDYDAYFEEAAKKYGHDPKLLKAIAGAESSWDSDAKGPVTRSGQRAQGLMQVMPDNFQPGENPWDPRDNIMAGARILRDGVNWANKHAGGDPEEALRYYNGGVRRGSKENREYAGRVNAQYRNIYGTDMPGATLGAGASPPARQDMKETNRLLQQIFDSGKQRGSGGGVVVYNNTGGNALVSSTQLGGFG
ncbi:lytic transglycosylase domain-containing protein [Yokenella regensburgei]|uniref:lytic transglycosylase domain-containing protein n=1 Tax=Yokenella regensburgei TaxID=158877 RepID=UPI003EDB0BFF